MRLHKHTEHLLEFDPVGDLLIDQTVEAAVYKIRLGPHQVAHTLLDFVREYMAGTPMPPLNITTVIDGKPTLFRKCVPIRCPLLLVAGDEACFDFAFEEQVDADHVP